MKVNLQDTKVGAFDLEFHNPHYYAHRRRRIWRVPGDETISNVNNGSVPCIIGFLHSRKVTEAIGGMQVVCHSNSKLDEVLRETLGPR